MKHALVTGASGFIGESLVRTLLERGYRVRALVRHEWLGERSENLEIVRGHMEDTPSLQRAVSDIDIVFHLAAAKSDEKNSEEINVKGSKNLAIAAKKNGVKTFVYLSTQSARLSSRGLYGETKLRGEEAIKQSGLQNVIIVRPSLVYGESLSGVLGSISRFIRLPIVPVFGSGEATFRPIHRDDLSIGLIKLAEETSGIFTLDAGVKEEYSFNALLDEMMQKVNRKSPVLHLPVWIGLLAAWILKILGIPIITRSNVLGGNEKLSMDIERFLRLSEIEPRSFRKDLGVILENTEKNEEARLLLFYVSGMKPNQRMMERYLEAVKAHALTSNSLRISKFSLRLLDAFTRLYKQECVLRSKLLIAAAIFESDTSSAEKLLPRRQSKLHVGISLLVIGIHAALIIVISQILILFPHFVQRHGGR